MTTLSQRIDQAAAQTVEALLDAGRGQSGEPWFEIVRARMQLLVYELNNPKVPQKPRRNYKEIPIKQWFSEEAQRLGIPRHSLLQRYYRLKAYPHLKLRRVNSRVVFVLQPI